MTDLQVDILWPDFLTDNKLFGAMSLIEEMQKRKSHSQSWLLSDSSEHSNTGAQVLFIPLGSAELDYQKQKTGQSCLS